MGAGWEQREREKRTQGDCLLPWRQERASREREGGQEEGGREKKGSGQQAQGRETHTGCACFVVGVGITGS